MNCYYDGLNLLYTTDGGAFQEKNIVEPDGSIVYGTRGASSAKYWYRQDVRGSITNIVNNSDTVKKSYTYDAYGNTGESGTLANSTAYTGAIKDDETGLYYMNALYYDPTTGRFISEDSYRGDGERFWHLYAYCNGDPVNFTDPTGHSKTYTNNYYAYSPIAKGILGFTLQPVKIQECIQIKHIREGKDRKGRVRRRVTYVEASIYIPYTGHNDYWKLGAFQINYIQVADKVYYRRKTSQRATIIAKGADVDARYIRPNQYVYGWKQKVSFNYSVNVNQGAVYFLNPFYGRTFTVTF